MQDDAHGGGKPAWQAADQLPERLHGACGPAYYDYAPTLHAGSTGEQPVRPDAGKRLDQITDFLERRYVAGLVGVTLPITPVQRFRPYFSGSDRTETMSLPVSPCHW